MAGDASETTDDDLTFARYLLRIAATGREFSFTSQPTRRPRYVLRVVGAGRRWAHGEGETFAGAFREMVRDLEPGDRAGMEAMAR